MFDQIPKCAGILTPSDVEDKYIAKRMEEFRAYYNNKNIVKLDFRKFGMGSIYDEEYMRYKRLLNSFYDFVEDDTGRNITIERIIETSRQGGQSIKESMESYFYHEYNTDGWQKRAVPFRQQLEKRGYILSLA